LIAAINFLQNFKELFFPGPKRLAMAVIFSRICFNSNIARESHFSLSSLDLSTYQPINQSTDTAKCTLKIPNFCSVFAGCKRNFPNLLILKLQAAFSLPSPAFFGIPSEF
jgi:hypothetical protein